MKNVFIILLFFVQASSCQKNKITGSTTPTPPVPAPVMNNDTSSKTFTYLALGDSYTIGHDVPAAENYPNQLISLLEKDNLHGQVKIIATTGWTTDNLKAALENEKSLLPAYDIVSLLIGVNNEYQGAPVASYIPAFEDLLRKSIALAGNKANHVLVISIPDWSVTPFAAGRDRTAISKEIDAYNDVNRSIAAKYGTYYLDITPWTREATNDPGLLAPDGLHPSGKEYARWAVKLDAYIQTLLR